MAREPELTNFRLSQLEASASEALATTTTNGLQPAAQFAAFAPPVANIAALQAIAPAARADGMEVLVLSDTGGMMSSWRFHATSVVSDASNNVAVTPSSGSGVWLMMSGQQVSMLFPFTFATADAAVLWTAPAGCRFRPRDAWWEIATSLTGGTSSAIGVHASPSGFSTKGDILGGAAGDVAATLVGSSPPYRMVGTGGAKLVSRTTDRLIMIGADTFVFDRITSAFTAGAGNIRILGDLLANAGA